MPTSRHAVSDIYTTDHHRLPSVDCDAFGLTANVSGIKVWVIPLHKGMLSNLDISPSTSVNWWIVAILTFHFDLIHVPGTHHGPDGLSRQPQQDGDNEDRDDEEDFADWIYQLHGFLHQIDVVNIHPPPTSNSLPLPFPRISTLAQATHLSEEDTTAPDTTDSSIDDYTLTPRSVQAKVDDSHLLKVFQWLQYLRRPDGLSDAESATFMWYCMDFFIDDNRLWHKDSHGAHKLLVDNFPSSAPHTTHTDIKPSMLPKPTSVNTLVAQYGQRCSLVY
jgi:hypothetical protein